MKNIKNILLFLPLILINFVKAYGEQYGTLIGGMYVDTEIIFVAILFLIFFAAFIFSTRKLNLFKNDGIRIIISIIFSIFSIFGLQRLGIDYSTIIFDLGIDNFLMQYFPWIIAIALIVIMFIWNVGVVIMILGSLITIAGIIGSFNQEIIYRWELTILLGIILFIIGLIINKKILEKITNSVIKILKKIKKLRKEYDWYRRRGQINKANEILKKIEMLSLKVENQKMIDETNITRRNIDETNITRRNMDEDQVQKRSPKKLKGEASLDVIIGNRSLPGGQTTLDLTNTNEIVIYVKNGGTGGTLGWRASSHNELSLSHTSGKLVVGQIQPIKVRVKSRNGREYASVIITGRGGGKIGGRGSRGRVMISFKIKNKTSSLLGPDGKPIKY